MNRTPGMGFEILNRMGELEVYVQNLDDLVCTRKFVDLFLNCSGGRNVVGQMDKSLGCLGKTPWDILTHL